MIFPMVWRGISLIFDNMNPFPPLLSTSNPCMLISLIKQNIWAHLNNIMTVTNLFVYDILILIFALHPDLFSFPLVFPAPPPTPVLFIYSSSTSLQKKRTGILELATKYDITIRLGTYTHIKAGWDNLIGEKKVTRADIIVRDTSHSVRSP